jgi:hypothetical protein
VTVVGLGREVVVDSHHIVQHSGRYTAVVENQNPKIDVEVIMKIYLVEFDVKILTYGYMMDN